MSQISVNKPAKEVKTRGDWTDLNRDGKRLERLIKMLDKRVNPSRKLKNPPPPLTDEEKLVHIDRIIKLTHEKKAIIECVLGVKDLLRELGR